MQDPFAPLFKSVHTHTHTHTQPCSMQHSFATVFRSELQIRAEPSDAYVSALHPRALPCAPVSLLLVPHASSCAFPTHFRVYSAARVASGGWDARAADVDGPAGAEVRERARACKREYTQTHTYAHTCTRQACCVDGLGGGMRHHAQVGRVWNPPSVCPHW